MASTLTIVFPGPPEQRQPVKVNAMQPLSAVLPSVCAKFRPALDPASIKMAVNKKAVDAEVPFRLANIPSGSILTVVSFKPLLATPAASPPAEAAPAAQVPQPVLLPPQQRGSSVQPAAAAPCPTPQPEAPQPTQPEQGPSMAATRLSSAEAPHPQPLQQSQGAPVTQETQASVVPVVDLVHLSRVAALCPPRDSLLTTEVALQRHQQAHLQQQAETTGRAVVGAPVMDEDDSFYELTPEDLTVLMRAAEARRKEEALAFKTQAMREADELARVQAYGPVALRLRFRDGVVVQARFAATDNISAVQEFVQQLLTPMPAGNQPAVALFTAPPKQVLKDLGQTLYKAGLVPAALVHVQLSGPLATGPTLALLRPEVAACMVAQLALEQPLPGLATPSLGAGNGTSTSGQDSAGGEQPSTAPPATSLSAAAAVAASRMPARQSQQPGHDGAPMLPKWFKR